jgi:hypothetical protein
MNTPDDIDRLAAAALDDTDQRILADLRRMWDAEDPQPDGLADRIRFAMTVASLEAEVARIVQESSLESGVRSIGVRSTFERASTVTFTSGSLSAMIDLENDDRGQVRVNGWVSETAVEVELRERHGSRTSAVDATGRFGFGAVESGLVHFVFRRTDDPAARPVITPTIEL